MKKIIVDVDKNPVISYNKLELGKPTYIYYAVKFRLGLGPKTKHLSPTVTYAQTKHIKNKI